jgi:hypothetical protein
MANLKDCALTLLASGAANLQNGDAKTTLYTVPTGKKAIVTHVVPRDPTDSLAGGNNFNIGTGANADTWKTNVDLSSLTAASDYMVITKDNTKMTTLNAGDAFGIKPVTGATADAVATLDVFGYEWTP